MSDDKEAAGVNAEAGPSAVMMAVTDLARAAEQASLVRLALSSGLLAHAAEAVTVADLAAAVNAPREPVAAVCTALVALGALHREGTRVRLSTTWKPLVEGGLDVLLERTLQGAAARQDLIEGSLAQPATYWAGGGTRRRALAESVTLPPATEFGRAVTQGLIAGIPGLDELLASGARWLELGCGVAGNALATAYLYPNVHVVGVDIAADLLDVARASARQLGVSDRVQFVECDAGSYTDDKLFDIVFWSQFFFPAATRKAALDNALARLRPGGLLLCPVLPGDRESPESGSPQAQQAALEAIIYRQWDVPVLSDDELAKEVTGAGFTDTRVHRLDFATVMTAFRP